MISSSIIRHILDICYHFIMSLQRLNITYLGTAQKPVHTIMHLGPRGSQAHQFWKTMQA